MAGCSAAFFTTDCVPDAECAAWKMAALVALALVYSLFYSICFRYEAIKVCSPGSSPPSAAEKVSSALKQEQRSSAFHVLMSLWCYQLAGLLLAVPSPLKFLDGSAIIMNIIGPSGVRHGASQPGFQPAVPRVLHRSRQRPRRHHLRQRGVLCAVGRRRDCAHLPARVWLPIFTLFQAAISACPEYWDNNELACGAMAVWGAAGKLQALFLALKWSFDGVTWFTFKGGLRRLALRMKSAVGRFFLAMKQAVTCVRRSPSPPPSNPDAVSAPPLAHPKEVRGRGWLDLGVTAYSAFMTLMIQCTTCVRVPGLKADDGSALAELRWFYDGRMACFSDSGEMAERARLRLFSCAFKGSIRRRRHTHIAWIYCSRMQLPGTRAGRS